MFTETTIHEVTDVVVHKPKNEELYDEKPYQTCDVEIHTHNGTVALTLFSKDNEKIKT